MRITESKHKSLLKRIALYLGAAAAALLSLKYLLPCLLPFIPAYLLALLIEPLVRLLMEKARFPRWLASTLCSLLLLLLLGGLVFTGLKRAYYELNAFITDLPSAINALSLLIERVSAYLSEMLNHVPDGAWPAVESVLRQISETGAALAADFSGKALSYLTSALTAMPGVLVFTLTFSLSIFFISSELPRLQSFFARQIPDKWRSKAGAVCLRLRETFGKWVKAQLMLMLVTFIALATALTVIGIEYSLFLAGIIALVDALPVLGVGTIMIPWSLVCFFRGDMSCGGSLLIAYLAVVIIRNILEPRLLAYQVGISPLASLAAVYAGYVTIGAPGLILFPILLMFIKLLSDWGYVRLWK